VVIVVVVVVLVVVGIIHPAVLKSLTEFIRTVEPLNGALCGTKATNGTARRNTKKIVPQKVLFPDGIMVLVVHFDLLRYSPAWIQDIITYSEYELRKYVMMVPSMYVHTGTLPVTYQYCKNKICAHRGKK